MFIALGYLAGFIGIAVGIIFELLIASKIQSFGVSYLEPYLPPDGKSDNGIFLPPTWKREYRNNFLDTKKSKRQEHISMGWKYPHRKEKE